MSKAKAPLLCLTSRKFWNVDDIVHMHAVSQLTHVGLPSTKLPNIEPKSGQRVVFAGLPVDFIECESRSAVIAEQTPR